MSAVVCLRSDRLAASYQASNGIMLLIRDNELGIRTQKNGYTDECIEKGGMQMIGIVLKGNAPIYEQLVAQIEEMILRGILEKDEILPLEKIE